MSDKPSCLTKDLIQKGKLLRTLTTDSTIVPLYVRTDEELSVLATSNLKLGLIQVKRSELLATERKNPVMTTPSMWCREGLSARVWPTPNRAYTFSVEAKTIE